jgi:hypothetical protein
MAIHVAYTNRSSAYNLMVATSFGWLVGRRGDLLKYERLIKIGGARKYVVAEEKSSFSQRMALLNKHQFGSATGQSGLINASW